VRRPASILPLDIILSNIKELIRLEKARRINCSRIHLTTDLTDYNTMTRRRTESSSSSAASTAKSVANATSKKKIEELLEFMVIQNRWNGPGFSNVMGLAAERLEPKQFFFADDKTAALTFRYVVPSRLLLTKMDCTTTLSTYLSVVEDVTSWALILASRGRHRYFGSCSLQAEWGPSAQLGLFPGSVVDVTARVSRRALDNLSSTEPISVETELRDAETGSIICNATIGKYLERAKKRRGRDVLLRFPLSRWCLSLLSKPKESEEVCPVSLQMSDMFESLDFLTHTRATFIVSPKHANTALGTSSPKHVHAGCQAILLEFMGRQVAQDTLAAPMAYLESIDVNFSSPLPASVRLMIEAFILTKQRRLMTMRVVVTRLDGGIVTEGILSFTDTMQALGTPISRDLASSMMATTNSGTNRYNASSLALSYTTERLATAAIPEFPRNPIRKVSNQSINNTLATACLGMGNHAAVAMGIPMQSSRSVCFGRSERSGSSSVSTGSRGRIPETYPMPSRT
jgi:acyl-coenzyme A thioesterase PaaI-like protein